MDLTYAVAAARIEALQAAAEEARPRHRSATRRLRRPWLQRPAADAPTPAPACATC